MRNHLVRWYLIIFKRRYYLRHRDDIDTYLELIPSGSLCFDVGANRGDKTKALLAAGMKVVSFEPQPDYLRHLEDLCSEYRAQLTTRNVAVGNCVGESELHLSEHVGEASLKAGWSSHSTNKSITVPVTVLDREIETYGCPYFCKVDVEGFEVEVFSGLNQPLQLISFEYHLDEENLALTLQCLERLNSLSEMVFNITGAEDNRLKYSEWKTSEEFMKVFPSQFRGDHQFRYGDIYVKRVQVS